MEIVSSTDNKLVMQEKCVQLFRFQYHSYKWVLRSLWTWWNLILLKWLNFTRSLVSDYAPLCSCNANNDTRFNVKNCINIDWNAWYIELCVRSFPDCSNQKYQKERREYLKLLLCKKIPLSCFLKYFFQWRSQ